MPNDIPDWGVATTSPQTELGTISVAAGVTSPVSTFTCPQGTQCVGYVCHENGSNLLPQLVTITGTQTKTQYVRALGSDGARWATFSKSDTSVDCTVQGNASGPSVVDFLATPMIAAAEIRQEPGQTLNVQLVAASSPQFAATQGAVVINGTLASLATVVLVAAIAGVQMYLHGCTIGPDSTAGTTIELQDTAGGILMDATMNLARETSMDFKGATLANKGAGLQIVNVGPVPGSPRGALSYGF